MRKAKKTTHPKDKEQKEPKKQTPTFLLGLPLEVTSVQAKHLRAHLEAGRALYNAVLGEANTRMHRMRADPRWQEARAIPRSQPQERHAAFSALRTQYGFSEYALHAFAKGANCSWIADHIDALLAQTLATRAYRAVNRVCLGKARRVRFKSKGRGLDSVENKRSDSGLRFVLEKPEEGQQGFLIWKEDRLVALIDWNDPVVKYGLAHPIKYARLIRRTASSPHAHGADGQGNRYFVQLALQGIPYHKPKHSVGTDTIGSDLGPSTIALVARHGEARLAVLCEELAPDQRAMRRLQRQMERQRRAANPGNYDEKGRIKKVGKKRLGWKTSASYAKTRRRKAERERKLKAHRKSLHGRMVHEIVRLGNTVIIEKISYKAWQKQYGRSVGLRAPGMFIELLRRTVTSTGGTLHEVPTRTTKLSQYCHGCGVCLKKPLAQRWHQCSCGIGPVQRDLYSAYLAASLDPRHPDPSHAQEVIPWESAEARLQAAWEDVNQRAKEGQTMPRSMGVPRARARLPRSLSTPTQEPAFSLRRGRLEAWKDCSEPLRL